MERHRGRETAPRHEQPVGVGPELARMVGGPLHGDRRDVERGRLKRQHHEAGLDAQGVRDLEARSRPRATTTAIGLPSVRVGPAS